MKMNAGFIAALALVAVRLDAGPAAAEGSAGLTAAHIPPTKEEDVAKAGLADKRYEEMLDRMQAAVEEVAQVYGNPTFLQVFTNDAGRASDLRQRLAAARSGEEAKQALAKLEKRREELSADIALKEREAAKLTAKLERQRAALDALAAAVEQARRAVEDTAK
jgi:multidrug resistance efflux pump